MWFKGPVGIREVGKFEVRMLEIKLERMKLVTSS